MEKHTLKDILFIVLVSTIANADEWAEMEIFAQHKDPFLKQYIDFENGIPGHGIIQHIMALINSLFCKTL